MWVTRLDLFNNTKGLNFILLVPFTGKKYTKWTLKDHQAILFSCVVFLLVKSMVLFPDGTHCSGDRKETDRRTRVLLLLRTAESDDGEMMYVSFDKVTCLHGFICLWNVAEKVSSKWGKWNKTSFLRTCTTSTVPAPLVCTGYQGCVPVSAPFYIGGNMYLSPCDLCFY